MIFITLGSQKFQFNRLLRAADELIASGALQEEVFAQTGYSDYQPQHYAFQPFLNREEYAERIESFMHDGYKNDKVTINRLAEM